MRTTSNIHRALIEAGLTLAGAALLVTGAVANELTGSFLPSSNHIVIHDADETLRDYCHTDANGTLRLDLPGGASFELVTSAADPEITNHGDGNFHVFDPAEVQSALADDFVEDDLRQRG